MKVNFDKKTGLVPVIIQDAQTKKVLMQGYMNQESLDKTLDSKRVCFYSRSKQRLWTKGEESGNYLELKSLKLDCDQDSILIQAIPMGPTCHKGTDNCWGEDNKPNAMFLEELESIITDRWEDGSDKKSYVKTMKSKGLNKIAQKVGEEAVELVIEAKDEDLDLFLNEAADLLFHQILLYRAKNVKLEQVIQVLKSRNDAKK
ncbi:MAG: bifunctional phosphoribosyl-AMP cyclohydrolase/phosphoribosyl-ATP diphosphatase HisIE [Flavobacteriaceae bacterium]